LTRKKKADIRFFLVENSVQREGEYRELFFDVLETRREARGQVGQKFYELLFCNVENTLFIDLCSVVSASAIMVQAS
jgi:hypothetical protein